MDAKMPAEPLHVPAARLYDQDFFAWTQETVRLLRARQFDRLDLEALIEEVQSMGGSQWREMDSRLLLLIQHLLKWRYQPKRRSRSWQSTLVIQRFELSRLLRQSPSLKPSLWESVVQVYPSAARSASAETGLPAATFPDACPFTPEQILDPDFLPD